MDQKITTKQLPANQLAYLLDPKYCQTDEDCLIRSNFCRLGGFNKYHASVDVWGCGPPDYEVKPNEFESIEESIQNDQTCGTPTADFTNATCVNNTCQANGFITCPNRSK